MRYGVCAPLEFSPALAAVGYDYIEPPLFSTLQPEQAEADVMPAIRRQLDGSSLLPEVWNLFLPGDLKLVGEHTDEGRQIRYLDNAFGRVADLGGQIVVFGSGGARNIPIGYSRTSALQQLLTFIEKAGDVSARHGVSLVIEPLNVGECNLINSVGEATQLVRACGRSSVGVLSDLYHIQVEGQSFDETRLAGPLLRHVHVAGAAGRRAPHREDITMLERYFQALKAGSYEGRISVEGSWDDLAKQAGQTLEVLRAAWAGA